MKTLHRLVAVSAVVGTLLAFLPSSASAYCRMTTSRDPAPLGGCQLEGVPLGWNRSCIVYAVDERGSRDLDIDVLRNIVGSSFSTWEEVLCDGTRTDFQIRETTQLARCRDAQYRTCLGNVNIVAFVDDWPERNLDPTAFAVTTVWHSRSTGEIFDADIQVNERLGPYGVCPSAGCPATDGDDGTVDLQNVLTHEIGHFFGIAHSPMINTTMYARSPRGETSKRILRTDDVNAICEIYPPGSATGECDFTPRGGLDLDCEDDEGQNECKGCAASGPVDRGSLALIVLALLVVRRRS